MNVNLDKNESFREKIVTLLKKNKLKILFLIIAIFIFLIVLLAQSEMTKRKNVVLSEKYIRAGLNLTNEKTEEAKKGYEEIIISGNKFYALLAFNTVLEKNLIKEEKKIIEYFLQLEKNKYSSDIKDLILLKKSLYLLKLEKNEAGKKILNNLIEKNSKYKPLAQEIIK